MLLSINDTLFLNENEKLLIYDIQNVSEPKFINKISMNSLPRGIAISKDKFYSLVSEKNENGDSFNAIRAFAFDKEMKFTKLGELLLTAEYDDRLILIEKQSKSYIFKYNEIWFSVLSIINFTDVLKPEEIANLDKNMFVTMEEKIEAITIDEEYIYVGVSEEDDETNKIKKIGLKIFDINNITKPELIGNWSKEISASYLYIQKEQDRIYFMTSNESNIISVVEKTNPINLVSFQLEIPIGPYWFEIPCQKIKGKYGVFENSSTLTFCNFTDLNNIELISEYQHEYWKYGEMDNIYAQENYILVTLRRFIEDNYVAIIDWSDPKEPFLITIIQKYTENNSITTEVTSVLGIFITSILTLLFLSISKKFTKKMAKIETSYDFLIKFNKKRKKG